MKVFQNDQNHRLLEIFVSISAVIELPEKNKIENKKKEGETMAKEKGSSAML